MFLRYPKDLRSISRLPFCYLCGVFFTEDDITDDDHVPPKTDFHKRDRSPPLKLKTHVRCNAALSRSDKQEGQLIALRRGEGLASSRDRSLKLVDYPKAELVALENLNVDAVIWRWIKGFHAALYREPLDFIEGSLRTPFPRAEKKNGRIVMQPILPQHVLFVETIKRNRAFQNIDRISINNGKLIYECVWCQFDGEDRWMCIFALDIYNWKDLGGHTKEIPARGCAGCYLTANHMPPDAAARHKISELLILNFDSFDPFAL